MPFFNPNQQNWRQPQPIDVRSFKCGYCGNIVSSDRGLKLGVNHDGSGAQVGGAYICPSCGGMTFFPPRGNEYYPQPMLGRPVGHLPQDLAALYEEARKCTSQQCHTGAVLLCRKMLMNIAVAQGAPPGQTFLEYVNYLVAQGFVPPNGRHWVDHIRRRGNEATHEISLMSAQDATELLTFTEMLLRFIYEFPQMVPQPPAP